MSYEGLPITEVSQDRTHVNVVHESKHMLGKPHIIVGQQLFPILESDILPLP